MPRLVVAICGGGGSADAIAESCDTVSPRWIGVDGGEDRPRLKMVSARSLKVA